MYIQNFGLTKSNQSVRTAISANVLPPITPQIPANPFRQKICLFNGSLSLNFYVAFGTTPGSAMDCTVMLTPGGYFEDQVSVDAISVVSNGTSLTDCLYVTEMS